MSNLTSQSPISVKPGRTRAPIPSAFKAYFAQFPKPVRERLQAMSDTIQKTMPEAEPCISYSMPAFRQNKRVAVYFAAYKKHIGFYPTAKPMAAFAPRLSGFKFSKGAVQFPHDAELPLKLIAEMTRFRLKMLD